MVDEHRFDPLDLRGTVALFRSAPVPWWISGGLALELHVGESWRVHDDIDVSLRRRDVAALPAVLTGWEIHVAAAGVLRPWRGEALHLDRHENNLWGRRSPTADWALDVVISEGDDERWVYRRDPAVTRPWDEAVLRRDDGIPYLAPEVQLLFKSKALRPKDDVDAEHVIPRLEPSRASWLARHLALRHPWQRLLR